MYVYIMQLEWGPQGRENKILMMGKGELRVKGCMWPESRNRTVEIERQGGC